MTGERETERDIEAEREREREILIKENFLINTSRLIGGIPYFFFNS